MYNFLGLLIRGAPGIDSSTVNLLKWLVYLLAIGFLVWLWWGKGKALTIEHIGVAVVLCVFASPHLHLHDLSLLLLPALGATVLLWQRDGWRRGAALALLPMASLLLFASDLVKAPLHYLAGYAFNAGAGGSAGRGTVDGPPNIIPDNSGSVEEAHARDVSPKLGAHSP